MKRLVFFLLAAWLAAVPAGAAPPAGDASGLGCGPRGRIIDELLLHRQSASRRQILALSTLPPRPARADAGGIAIIEPINGVVVNSNTMDLPGHSVRFTPAPGGYTATAVEAAFDQAAVQNGPDLALGDDDDTRVALPFSFSYFGVAYTELFVNSDGNVTFGAAESVTADRALSRALSGPPRIFPLFADLDPTRPSAAVRAFLGADRFVLTWDNVPLYTDSGFGPRTTFQVFLFPDGAIQFNYSIVQFGEAVAGIAPGGLTGQVAMIDLTVGGGGLSGGGFAEIFATSRSIDIQNAAVEFYRNHDDAYDVIAVFNDLGIASGAASFAFEVNVRNDVRGIGDIIPGSEVVDFGSSFGSPRRLQSFLNMGPVANYPDDPNTPLFVLPENNSLTVLSHEFGHRFLAYVQRRDPQTGFDTDVLLGRQLAHWSFLFNTHASVMEGNEIEDRGASLNPRFVTTAAADTYSELDQYIMGLIPAEEVDPSFVVTNPSGPVFAGRAPTTGVQFNGTRTAVSLDEIIAAEGIRVPHASVAQRDFNVGIMLVVREGQQPSQQSLDRLERLRSEWETFVPAQTQGRARVHTGLVRQLHLSTWPAAGAIIGQDLPARLELAAPLDDDLEVAVNVTQGFATLTTAAAIPAGARTVDFMLPLTAAGVTAGVAEVTAEAASSGFEQPRTLLQIRQGQGSLQIEVESGDAQSAGSGAMLPRPVVFRVLDENRLPYAGLPVTLAASGDGAAAPIETTSGLDGRISVNWMLDSSAQANTLSLALVDAPAVTAAATATGLGSPPSISAEGVVNAASFNTGLSAANLGISPGSLVSLFGASLAPAEAVATRVPLPPELGDTRVWINGIAAPLLFVSGAQVNLQVPFTVAGAEVSLTLEGPAGSSTPLSVPLADSQPGIFFDPATGIGAILNNSDGTYVGNRAPTGGDIIQVFATGLGAVEPAVPSGAAAPADPLSFTVLAATAGVGLDAEVLFSGLAPGFVGLYQVNVQIPPSAGPIPAGQQIGIQLTIGGRLSNIVGLPIAAAPAE